MARLRVMHERNDYVYVELSGGQDDGDWDGSCNGPECQWTVSGSGARVRAVDDAINEADVHLDSH